MESLLVFGYRGTLFPTFTGTNACLWLPWNTIVLVYGHQCLLLVTVERYFPRLRASLLPFGYREMLFSSFTGTNAYLWLPRIAFFLVYGHQCLLLVTVERYFPRLRASLLLFGYRGTLFFSFTGTYPPLWLP